MKKYLAFDDINCKRCAAHEYDSNKWNNAGNLLKPFYCCVSGAIKLRNS